MECGTCKKEIKKSEFFCTECLNKKIQEKLERFKLLSNQLDELKQKCTEISRREQERLHHQKQKRQQIHRINQLNAKIHQMKNVTIPELKLENVKLSTNNTTLYRQFIQSNKILHDLMVQWNKKNMLYEKAKRQNASDIIKESEKLQKARRRTCKSLFDQLPIYQKNEKMYICSDSLCIPLRSSLDEIDERILSASLGYLVLIISTIAYFLNVELRYAMEYFGCQSKIWDPSEDAKYPLYREGVKKEDFEKAMKMFNANVVQLCISQGLVVIDENLENWRINILSLYNLTTIGREGPHTYYTDETVEGPNNYYVERDVIKYIEISPFASTRMSPRKNNRPTGILAEIYREDYFGTEEKNPVIYVHKENDGDDDWHIISTTDKQNM